jgi:hypothetical protein
MRVAGVISRSEWGAAAASAPDSLRKRPLSDARVGRREPNWELVVHDDTQRNRSRGNAFALEREIAAQAQEEELAAQRAKPRRVKKAAPQRGPFEGELVINRADSFSKVACVRFVCCRG